MSALRECPFCSGRGEPQETGLGDQLAVVCNECGADGGWHDTEAAAIAAWNRRAGDGDVEKLRAELTVAKSCLAVVPHRQKEMNDALATLRAEVDALRAERDQFVGLTRKAEAAEKTLRARVERLEGAIKNAADAIERADPGILICTLWMPENVSLNETVVDHLRAAGEATP